MYTYLNMYISISNTSHLVTCGIQGAGIIYVSASDLGWQPIKATWMLRRPEINASRQAGGTKTAGQCVSLTPSSDNVDLNQQPIGCSDVFRRFLGMSCKSSLYGPVGYVCQFFVTLVPQK